MASPKHTHIQATVNVDSMLYYIGRDYLEKEGIGYLREFFLGNLLSLFQFPGYKYKVLLYRNLLLQSTVLLKVQKQLRLRPRTEFPETIN